MNAKFNLGNIDIQIPVPGQEETAIIKMSDITYEVEGLDIKEYVLVMKEMVNVYRQIAQTQREQLQYPVVEKNPFGFTV